MQNGSTKKATGYSLWLVPEKGGEAYQFLERVIQDIGSDYQTPLFDPHVTLVGGVEGLEKTVLKKARELAKELTPYEIELGEIDSNGTYFQILFSQVMQTISVMHAGATAQKVFGMEGEKYFPHLSLAYGAFSQEQVNGLMTTMGEKSIKGTRFFVDRIEVWSTEGFVEEWRKVAEVPLGE